MTIKATTTAPDEARRLFNEFADLLDMYASDQLATLRWPGNKAAKRLRANVYSELALEVRAIEFELPE